jgi:hypothetical protein
VLQDLPPLSKEAEERFVEFQRQMNTQYQVTILSRYILTLPALPEEGY